MKDVGQLFQYYLPHLYAKMNLPNYDSELIPIDLKEKFHTRADKAQKLSESTEAQNYFYILLLMKLIDEKRIDLAKDFVDFASSQLVNEFSRTMDYFIAKVYYYKGLIYEKQGKLNLLCAEFFDAYRAAAN